MKLLSELRRRNVLRMVVLYLGAAWLVMQVVDVLIDRGPLPESLGPLMLVVLTVGFPIALTLSWFYEVTPEGVTLDEAARQGAARTASGRGLDFIVISVLAAAVVLFAWDKWWTGPPPGRSVAVLPFADMSVEQDSAYFAAGVSDSVLNMLAQVPDLHVASRTSSFQPRLEGLGTQEIAGLLGVATVLEGSVQRQGDRLRITAQLIDAQDDSHLWSRHFDRSDSDIFSIQDEIAEAVTSALELSLLGDTKQRIDREGTDNLQAFEEYSKAMDNLRVRTFDSVKLAAQQLQKATKLDPDFARAHAMLGHVYLAPRFHDDAVPNYEELRVRARDAANRALQIAPGMSTALALLGAVTEDNDAKGQLLREAMASGPSDVLALRAYTYHLFGDRNQFAEATALAEKLIGLDPLDEENYQALMFQQLFQVEYQACLDTAARGIRKIPNSVSLRDVAAFCHLGLGDYRSAIVAKYETLQFDPKEFSNRFSIATIYLLAGIPNEAERWFDRAAIDAPKNARIELVSRALLDVYFQRNDEQVFETLRAWILEDFGWRFGLGMGPGGVFIEYGVRLGRLDDVLETYQQLHPQLFTDPATEIERDRRAALIAGAALLRSGDVLRGEPLIKVALEALEERERNSWFIDPASVMIYLLLGDNDSALQKFREFVGRNKWHLALNAGQFLLRHSALFDPIRYEPEFVELLDTYDRNAAEQRRLLEEMAGQLTIK